MFVSSEGCNKVQTVTEKYKNMCISIISINMQKKS